jgi:hypothetical protein
MSLQQQTARTSQVKSKTMSHHFSSSSGAMNAPASVEYYLVVLLEIRIFGQLVL